MFYSSSEIVDAQIRAMLLDISYEELLERERIEKLPIKEKILAKLKK